MAAELGMPTRATSADLARLSQAFLVHLLPAWSTNVSSKVVHRPKLTLVDAGLASSLIGATPASLQRDGELLGQLLKTFVVSEVRKQLGWSDTRTAIWHFRDRSGGEVDLLLEAPNGDLIGIEVKATSTPGPKRFKGLRFLADRVGPRLRYGFVVSLAPEALPFGDRLAAIPVDRLWA